MFVCFLNTGAAAAFQEDKMDHSHDEPDQSSPRMSWRYSELPVAKLLPRLKDDLCSSTSALQDRGATVNTNTERTRNFLNGYSDSEGSVCSSIDGDRDGDDEDNQEITCKDDNESDNGDDSLDDDDDNGDNDSDGDDDNDHNDDDDRNIDQDASYSCPDGNISLVSDSVNESLIQKSALSLQDGSCNDENTNSDQNNVCRPPESSNISISGENLCVRNEESCISSECDDDAELLAVGIIPPFTSKKESPIVSVGSNVTRQGARPKTSSQATVISNEVHSDLPGGKIPSLDVIGISQGFLARHSTDQSLPYSASTEDLRTSQSTSSIDWHQTSVTSDDNSSASWNLLGPPFLDRNESLQGRAYPSGVQPWYGNPRNVGYQPVTKMTGLGSGWQLSNQQQPPYGRTAPYCLPENQRMSNRAVSCLTYQDEPLTHPNGHFLGASGTQGGDSFNRQASMPGNYETSWPRELGELAVRNDLVMNLPAVNPSQPAVTLPSVTLPSATLNLQTAASVPVTSQSSSSTAISGSDNLHLSQATTSTEDDSLVALERKVAEACALVERVLKEREERTKRQREEMQRQREIREQRQREAREMREREEREMREREEREAREEMAGVERAPVQESPLWQCEHYQRRCSVRFPCCEVFYPCHRCHNGSEACDADDKKANQATHVKCANCGHEEEVSGFILYTLYYLNN